MGSVIQTRLVGLAVALAALLAPTVTRPLHLYFRLKTPYDLDTWRPVVSKATLLTTLGTVETPRELRLRATTVTGRHPHSQPFERQLDCGLSCGDGENTSDVTAGHIRNPVLTVEALLARVRSMPGRSLYSTNGVYPCAGRP